MRIKPWLRSAPSSLIRNKDALKWASFRAISGNGADHGELQGLAAAPAGALPRLRARAGLGARGQGGPGGPAGVGSAQIAGGAASLKGRAGIGRRGICAAGDGREG